MNEYIRHFISRLKNHKTATDIKTLLQNNNWVSIKGLSDQKNVIIFRSNNQLLLSQGGGVTSGKWDVINEDYLLLELPSHSYLMRFNYLDDFLITLKPDGSSDPVLFINETRTKRQIDNVNDIETWLRDVYSITKGIRISLEEKYFYLERNKDVGPISLLKIRSQVKDGLINPMSFIRHVSEPNYSKRVRIKTLLELL